MAALPHRLLLVSPLLASLVVACGADEASGPPDACFEHTVSQALCDPSSVQFTLDSTNPWYPLTPGLEVVLEGIDSEDGVSIRVERTVTDEVRTVAGVETHVLIHREYRGGELYEVANNFYVETVDGTVCYFGEEVTFYEGGAVANHNGTWEAGVDGAVPGVIMPADPAVGQQYQQETAVAQEALDEGRVVEVGTTWEGAGETFTDVVVTSDVSPYDDCEGEPKRYVPGIGEVQDVDALLVSYTLPTP